jgi:hypothetical protein
MNQTNQAVGIEVHIRQRRKNGLNAEGVDFRISRDQLPPSMRIHRDTLDHMDKEILKNGSCLIFSANSEGPAAFTFRGLLALVTEP